MKKIVVVAGVTAAGKTGAAIALTKRLGGELVGADSVQVYRGFDIGSAKPTAAELDGVRHHLIDVVDPDEAIDASRFASLADEAILDIAGRGLMPIVVGGTGLWLRALLRGLVNVPPPDPIVRAALEREAELDPAALHERLRAVDKVAAARIHPNDRLRIVRALEVFEQTGRPLGDLHVEHQLGAPRYDAYFVALDRPRDELYAAIKERTRAMLASGWVDEVRALLDRWGPDVRPMQSVGYAQIAEHLRDGVPIEETERRIYKATRIYTRRQRTWLRGMALRRTDAVRWTTAIELARDEGIDRWLAD
jgi:tRNA dimethylallyltransferase